LLRKRRLKQKAEEKFMLDQTVSDEKNGYGSYTAAEGGRGAILEIARELGPRFAERSGVADEQDLFVAENFAELKARGLLAAAVPQEFGGFGATQAELSEMLREIARHCGSTALAFSMHTHQVAPAAWRWCHQKAPVDGLLKRVAKEGIVILSRAAPIGCKVRGRQRRWTAAFLSMAGKFLRAARRRATS